MMDFDDLISAAKAELHDTWSYTAEELNHIEDLLTKAYKQGCEDTKKECIEVVNRQALDDFVLQTIMGKIKKL